MLNSILNKQSKKQEKMENNYVSISKYSVNNELDIKNKRNVFDMNSHFYIYEGIDDAPETQNKDVISLTYFKDLSDLKNIMKIENENLDNLKDYLMKDVEREILFLEDKPINDTFDTRIDSQYIQIRKIEVLPKKYESYRNWREQSIFNFVRKNKDTIKTFGAYHSQISGNPGVTFISLFDDINKHENIFNSKEYNEILVTADKNFIINGRDKGLNLINYKKAF